jgi:hypothetical protein
MAAEFKMEAKSSFSSKIYKFYFSQFFLTNSFGMSRPRVFRSATLKINKTGQ